MGVRYSTVFQPSVAVSIPSACSLSPRPPTSLSFLSLCSAPGCSIRLSVSTTACPLALLPSLALACCRHCLSSGIGGMHSLTQSLKDASDIMQEWYFLPADRLGRWRGVQILAVEHGSDGGAVHSSLGKCIVTKLEPLRFYSYNQKLFRHF
ncbi:hypothetical protein BGW80DRAFT_1286025 [Lactifluus volemus]|nr:hypothetical protein BGW80DRAFT_1286025 [Lactifluus volemus]